MNTLDYQITISDPYVAAILEERKRAIAGNKRVIDKMKWLEKRIELLRSKRKGDEK